MPTTTTELAIRNFFLPYPLINYSKGEIILRGEDTPDGVYFIEKGFVRMYTLFPDGRELTQNIYKPKTYFPMVWAITNSHNSYFFQAHTVVQMRKAPKNQVVSFIQKDSRLLYDLTQRILTGLEGLLDHLQYLFGSDAHKRVASALRICALRFGEKKYNSVFINLPLTHQDIANLCGLTRETTSLELKKLENEGLISQQHHLFKIKNLTLLEKKLNPDP